MTPEEDTDPCRQRPRSRAGCLERSEIYLHSCVLLTHLSCSFEEKERNERMLLQGSETGTNFISRYCLVESAWKVRTRCS